MIEAALLLGVGAVLARVGLWPHVRRQAAAAVARRQAEQDALAERIARDIVERVHRAAERP